MNLGMKVARNLPLFCDFMHLKMEIPVSNLSETGICLYVLFEVTDFESLPEFVT